MKCRHENAKLDHFAPNFSVAHCPNCHIHWKGVPYIWYSKKNNENKPPKWVTKLIEERNEKKT